MAAEIERKFLVTNQSWRRSSLSVECRQGYLSTTKERTVRVRRIGNKGYLTVKGRSVGSTRAEFEYEIPSADAEEMLSTLCVRPLIEKVRHTVQTHGLVWEIDEFSGENSGLIVAEVELTDEAQPIDRPDWVGAEVTHDPRYFNSSLVAHPFVRWKP